MLRMMMHMLVRKYALKSYFLILVGTSIFVDKSATYVDVVYLKFFMDFGTDSRVQLRRNLFGLLVIQVRLR